MSSASIKLEELNDFLNPEQDCVVQIVHTKPIAKKPNLIKLREKTRDLRSIEKQASSSETATEAAEVSLNDCLACSGCVTTSEVVFIQEHSLEAFVARVEESRFSIVSFSAQSLDFLASFYGIPPQKLLRKLSWALKVRLNVSCVVDQTVSDALLLVESYREFLKCLINGRANQTLITSHCSGWVSFARKTQPQGIIDSISQLKSSQQVLGHLLKTITQACYNFKQFYREYSPCLNKWHRFSRSSQSVLLPEDIFHTAIEPCYDKKLEVHYNASTFETGPSAEHSELRSANDAERRSESATDLLSSKTNHQSQSAVKNGNFSGEAAGADNRVNTHDLVKEVDLVLSTHELLQLLHRIDFQSALGSSEEEMLPDDIFLGCFEYIRLVFPEMNHECLDGFLHELQSQALRASEEVSLNSDCLRRQKSAQESFCWSSHKSWFLSNRPHSLSHPSKYCLCCHIIRFADNSLTTSKSGCFLDFCYRQTCLQRSHNAVSDKVVEASSVKYVTSSTNAFMLDLRKSIPLTEKPRIPFSEARLQIASQKLRFVLAYGFQNIQNMVQMLSQPSKNFDSFTFIELMACPKGCAKGGGQRVPSEMQTESRPSTMVLDDLDSIVILPQFHPYLPTIYQFFMMTQNSPSIHSAKERPCLRAAGAFQSSTENLMCPADWLETQYTALGQLNVEQKEFVPMKALRW